MTEVFVNMGEIRVLRSTGVLTTVGLGSCVGEFYDPITKVGALAHVFLAESRARIVTLSPENMQIQRSQL